MIRIDRTPCSEYLDWVMRYQAFLDGPAWAGVLESGLSASSRFVWDGKAGLGHLLAMFKRGPFCIGYLGFPLCTGPRTDADTYVLDEMVHAIMRSKDRPDLLRIPLSPFGSRTLASVPHSVTATVETCITDLSSWSATATARRRRHLSVANRHCKDLTHTTRLDPAELHELYRFAVRRNHGILRYGRAYFEALATLDEQILSIQALKHGDAPASMVLTAMHGDCTCYLHGGTSPAALGMGASDFLMARSIYMAQASGSSRYNFLASPVRQRGLSKFKEKWGGETRPSATVQIATTHKGYLLARLLAVVQFARTLHTKATSA